MTINVMETVRKMMGWCPNATPVKHKYIQAVDFAHLSLEPSGRPNVENFHSKNIMFSSNTILFTLCFVISLNLILALARNLDYAILIPILAGIYFLLYLIAAKTFKAHISIDENGVHLRYFELRDVILNYRDIKSITINKVVNPPIVLIAIALLTLLVIVALLTYSAMSGGEWKLPLSVAPLLPWYLLVKHKQDKEYHNLNTQLYIQHEDKNRRKRWHELTSTSYYSIITDEMTASGIQAAIEHYRGAN
ncbi:MAG: hypothetical protein O8C64_05140 [Candidatus Methanoperedens sp.]|nr:hypothetical protein [Candidatus Methanoperedens sp.]MCZ7405588.1 hypothetical protein [Candidatus Methanoperedens sp.]